MQRVFGKVREKMCKKFGENKLYGVYISKCFILFDLAFFSSATQLYAVLSGSDGILLLVLSILYADLLSLEGYS